jgi:hypothetical protein
VWICFSIEWTNANADSETDELSGLLRVTLFCHLGVMRTASLQIAYFASRVVSRYVAVGNGERRAADVISACTRFDGAASEHERFSAFQEEFA